MFPSERCMEQVWMTCYATLRGFTLEIAILPMRNVQIFLWHVVFSSMYSGREWCCIDIPLPFLCTTQETHSKFITFLSDIVQGFMAMLQNWGRGGVPRVTHTKLSCSSERPLKFLLMSSKSIYCLIYLYSIRWNRNTPESHEFENGSALVKLTDNYTISDRFRHYCMELYHCPLLQNYIAPTASPCMNQLAQNKDQLFDH